MKKGLLRILTLGMILTMLTGCQKTDKTVSERTMAEETTEENTTAVEETETGTEETLASSDELSDGEFETYTAGDLSILLSPDYILKEQTHPRAGTDTTKLVSGDEQQSILLISSETEIKIPEDVIRGMWLDICLEGAVEAIEGSGEAVAVESETDKTEVEFAGLIWTHKSITLISGTDTVVYDCLSSASAEEGVLRSIEIHNYNGDNQQFVQTLGDIVSIGARTGSAEEISEADFSKLFNEAFKVMI